MQKNPQRDFHSSLDHWKDTIVPGLSKLFFLILQGDRLSSCNLI